MNKLERLKERLNQMANEELKNIDELDYNYYRLRQEDLIAVRDLDCGNGVKIIQSLGKGETYRISGWKTMEGTLKFQFERLDLNY